VKALNHFGTQVIDCLHFGSLECQLPLHTAMRAEQGSEHSTARRVKDERP
jgi:hypothetical protein